MELTPEQRESRLGWRLVAPCLGVIGLLIIYPILYNLYLSFFDVKLTGDNIFVGLANYEKLLKDTAFYGSVLTTFIYLVGTVFGTTLVALLVALLMNIEPSVISLCTSQQLQCPIMSVFRSVIVW